MKSNHKLNTFKVLKATLPFSKQVFFSSILQRFQKFHSVWEQFMSPWRMVPYINILFPQDLRYITIWTPYWHSCRFWSRQNDKHHLFIWTGPFTNFLSDWMVCRHGWDNSKTFHFVNESFSYWLDTNTFFLHIDVAI